MLLSLAPIQGYTHVFYRYAHAKTFNTIDKYYTPFFEDNKANGWEPELLPELDKKLNNYINLVPQVVTNTPEFLIRSAEQFVKMGYSKINLNMGCPFSMLVKRKKGAGLLTEPELVKNILSTFFKKTQNIKLSVKMRIGINEPDEWEKVIGIINDYPVSEIIVHPRTVKQKYGGNVNWDEFEKIAERCIHPITGNGDINCKQDYLTLQSRFPQIKSWMLGRGALTNPYMPSEIKGVEYTTQKKKELLYQFHNSYLQIVQQHFPVWNHAFNYLKSFWCYPIKSFANGHKHYKKLRRYLNENEYKRWVEEL